MKRIIHRGAKTLLFLGIIWVVFVVIGWALQDRLIFPRWLANDRASTTAPANADVWTVPINTEDHVEAWFFAAEGAPSSAPAIVLTHGNAELIDDLAPVATAWSRRGYHVLLPEYRGYGRCGDAPSERGIVQDVCNFIDRLKSRPDVDTERIAMIGRSIGCGVACQVALKHDPKAMILIVPPARIDSIAWSYGFPSFLVNHPFRSDLALPQIDAPVLIIQRDRDEVIPDHHAGILHEAAGDSRLLRVQGSHNVATSPEAEQDAVRGFLDRHLQKLDPARPD
ncbi:MAG: alpha/beta fold hydrolase [Phycisphaerales bacterium]|jgi:hypothetical protein|nr:alpha/beta fold hydrolase [Phycisphaerales bacterium]